jgi:5-formyltetrahydrofolate cyclo-ligase
MIPEQKQSLRAEARRYLLGLDLERKRAAGQKILSHLTNWNAWVTARTVCAFTALVSEPDVLTPWPDGKQIILPRVVGSQVRLYFVDNSQLLVAGKFGILEPGPNAPVAQARADMILVPGLAFDRKGVRLGRGGGYYDRLLTVFEGLRVGVCFEESVLERIPSEPHDAHMDFLLTPGGIISCGTRNTKRDSGV